MSHTSMKKILTFRTFEHFEAKFSIEISKTKNIENTKTSTAVVWKWSLSITEKRQKEIKSAEITFLHRKDEYTVTKS